MGAAIWVTVYHAIQVIPDPTNVIHYEESSNLAIQFLSEGWVAVTVFIVLSGFSLARGLKGKSVRWAGYFGSRWLRIAPLYLLVLFLTLAAGHVEISPGAFFEDLTMLPLPNSTGADLKSPYLWTTWSVRVEFLIYFFLPALVSLGNRFKLKNLVLLLLPFFGGLYFLVIQVSGNPAGVIYWSFVGRLAEFSVGFAIGFYGLKLKNVYSRRISLTAGLSLLFLISAYANSRGSFDNLSMNSRILVQLVSVLATVLLVFWANQPTRISRFKSPALDAFVQSSYSIYIWHMAIVLLLGAPLFERLTREGISQNIALWASLATTILCTAVWSTISYVVIEKPFLSLRTKYVSE